MSVQQALEGFRSECRCAIAEIRAEDRRFAGTPDYVSRMFVMRALTAFIRLSHSTAPWLVRDILFGMRELATSPDMVTGQMKASICDVAKVAEIICGHFDQGVKLE